MKTTEIFKKKTVFSFEVFPPKREAPIETIYKTLDGMKGLAPDFISVTYGAGGSENSAATIEIARAIKNDYKIEGVAHLPAINLSKKEAKDLLVKISENGIENVLALRGDIVPGISPKEDFPHASDLVTFIKENSELNIIGACYPEGHPEAANVVEDIRNLKTKVNSGVTHLISQLFFDNSFFYSFLERVGSAGIEVPVEAGIMPVVNKKQIERMVSLCRVKLPDKFIKMMNKYEHSPEAMRDAGIAYAVDQIVDLLTQGVSGIHLYTMNNAYIAKRISEAVANLFI